MRSEHVEHLRCPGCRADLRIGAQIEGSGSEIAEGSLACTECEASYPITRHVPRFVDAENYASGFGLQWSRHARTQYDSYSGAPLSEQRFFSETGWPRRMGGEILIEPGSGSGRFTEQAASTGATVLSLDYSYAVDANYELNGTKSNVVIVQGDLYRMPFPEHYADRIFCLGVLQHTPDPRAAFLTLPQHLKPGGELVTDVYRKSFVKHVLATKYWVRPLTRRMKPEQLYRYVRRYVDIMWPLASLIRRVPRIGPALNWRLLVADYSAAGVPERVLKEWAYLDTFDMLSPRYDFPQTLEAAHAWLGDSPLEDTAAYEGWNGIVLRGRRPRTRATAPS